MQEDKDIKGALISTITLFTIKNSVFCNSNMLARYNSMANYLIIAVVFLMYARCLLNRKLKIKINKISILICVVIVCFIVLSYLFNASAFYYPSVIDDLTSFFSYSFFPLIFLPMCENIDGLKKLMFKWGYVMSLAAFLGFVLFYLNGSKDINGLAYSMGYGKNVCFPIAIMILKYRDERKLKDLALVVSMVIFILLIGSRFPLLYISTYILILFWNDMHKILRAIFLFLIAILSYVLLIDNGMILIRIVEKIPIFTDSSRTISMLKSGVLLDDSARSDIHNMLLERANQSPIFGYGFGGGVYALKGELAHGFIYDCIGSLGYVFGILFIIASFAFILNAWWKCRHNQLGDIMLMFMCLFFPTVTLQESLFNAYKFWWLIAFALYFKSRRRVKIYEHKENT